MNSRQGDPNVFVATNNVKATFEGCIAVTEAAWIPHRIRFPEMFNTTIICIYGGSDEKTSLFQKSLSPGGGPWSSLSLLPQLATRQGDVHKNTEEIMKRKYRFAKKKNQLWKKDRHFLVDYFVFKLTGGKLDGREKSWRDWARNREPWSWSKVIFPQFSIQIYLGNKTSIFLCPAPVQYRV